MPSVSHQHSRPTTPESIMDALASPFESTAIRFKPGVVSGNRALAIPYVDARAIQDRLDEVLGLVNWQDEYECMNDGSVICRLRVRIGSEWICKVDVGGPSEQPDEGDRRKAAFSDALKRAAVKFGVGRYLHRQSAQWQDFDPVRKQFAKPYGSGAPASSRPANTRREPWKGESSGNLSPRGARPQGEPPGRELQKRDDQKSDTLRTHPAAREPVTNRGPAMSGPRTLEQPRPALEQPRSTLETRRPEAAASGSRSAAT